MNRIAAKLFGDRFQWSVPGAGRHQLPLATRAALMRGSLRVGLKDSLLVGNSRLLHFNAEQVLVARENIERLGFEVATPEMLDSCLA